MKKTVLILGILSIWVFFSCDPNNDNDDHDDTQQQIYSIYEASVYDHVDNDGDGYASQVSLRVDADVSYGSSYAYFVFYYRYDSSDWYDFGQSDSFLITGLDSEDSQNFILSGFDHYTYDIGVQLYDYATGSFWDSYNSEDNQALSGILLETDEEDSPQTLWLSHHDASFEDEKDINIRGHRFPVKFVVPEEALTCTVKEVRCYISRLDNPGDIETYIDIIDILEDSVYLDTSASQYPYTVGWHSYELDADVTDYDYFFASFVYYGQLFMDDCAIGIDTSEPISGMCYGYYPSPWYWTPSNTEDFGIEVLLEYTLAGLD